LGRGGAGGVAGEERGGVRKSAHEGRVWGKCVRNTFSKVLCRGLGFRV